MRAWLADNWDPDITVARVVGAARPRSGYGAPTWPEDDFGAGYHRGAGQRGERGDRRRPGRSGRRPGSGTCSPGRRSSPTARVSRRTSGCTRILNGQDALVPAVQRAGRGLRPRRPAVQGRARRRRVGHHRPEGLDLDRAALQPRHAHRPHRSRRAEAHGDLVLRVRHGPARRRDPAAARDDRPRDVQRGLPRRRARARLEHDRRPEQRLGRRQHDARGRARRARQRRQRRGGLGVPGSEGRSPRQARRRHRRPGPHRRDRRRRGRHGPAPHQARPGARGKTDDPLVRQGLARMYSLQQIGKYSIAADEDAAGRARARRTWPS